MVSFQRSLLLGVLLMVFVVACGGTANTGKTSSGVGATMTTQTNNTQGGTANTGMPGPSVGATMTAQTNNTQMNSNQNNQGGVQMTPTTTTKTLISTKRVNVRGHMVTVLTTFHGMTLYERTSDPAPDSSCTGSCAHAWPPLLSKGTVMSTAPIGGALTVHMTANGKQVEYKGHPLYTYSGDMAPGQANGQGVGMVWQIVTVARQRQHW